MFCKKCGTELQDDNIFCSNCGDKIGGASNDDPFNNQSITTSQRSSSSTFDTVIEKNAWGYFIDALKKYAVFKGRARRAEYWWFTFFATIFSTAIGILEGIFEFITLGYIRNELGFLTIIWSLAIIIPSFSVTVRRLHDYNRSGWFMLVPIYGFVIRFFDGTIGPNRYGEDPKGRTLKNNKNYFA
jgi:uncharacterized membrane protein YhaH (DUF805 family)